MYKPRFFATGAGDTGIGTACCCGGTCGCGGAKLPGGAGGGVWGRTGVKLCDLVGAGWLATDAVADAGACGGSQLGVSVEAVAAGCSLAGGGGVPCAGRVAVARASMGWVACWEVSNQLLGAARAPEAPKFLMALRKSSADWKRSAGSFAMARIIISLSPAGRSPRN